MEDDKKIAGLLRGVYRFFNSKFPPKKSEEESRVVFKVNHYINGDGYHMDYLNVNYTINFSYDERLMNPRGHNLIFKLKVELSETDKDLEQRLNEIRISNTQLDKMSGLTGQKIEVNEKSINISCKLKKIPVEENEIDNLCNQLWGYVIKRAFRAIYNF